MSTYTTPAALGTPWPDGTTRSTRLRSISVALLACVPLPLLSLGAMLLPIPDLAERAAANFAPFLESSGERVVRERVAARTLEIRVDPSEPTVVAEVPASGIGITRSPKAVRKTRTTARQTAAAGSTTTAKSAAASDTNAPTADPVIAEQTASSLSTEVTRSPSVDAAVPSKRREPGKASTRTADKDGPGKSAGGVGVAQAGTKDGGDPPEHSSKPAEPASPPGGSGATGGGKP
jgi:hypothetical protein